MHAGVKYVFMKTPDLPSKLSLLMRMRLAAQSLISSADTLRRAVDRATGLWDREARIARDGVMEQLPGADPYLASLAKQAHANKGYARVFFPGANLNL